MTQEEFEALFAQLLLDSQDDINALNLNREEVGASLGLTQSAASQNLGLLDEERGLNRENLFARANIQFRNLANNFATRGLGDSGFAQRARHEFGDQRERDDRAIDINFRQAQASINQSLARAELGAGFDLRRIDNQQAALNAIIQGEIDVVDLAEAMIQQGIITPEQADAQFQAAQAGIQ